MWADPERFVQGQPTVLTVQVRPLFSGTGFFALLGYGGGSPVGHLESPVQAEVGVVVVPAAFTAGQTSTLACTLHVETILDHIGIGVYAQFDSLVLDGKMYPVGSQEVHDRFGSDLLCALATWDFTLDREAQP
jgi:hypothetical protein